MKKMEAEMKQKVFLAECPGVHIHPVLLHGSRPYRCHVSGSNEWWISQGPMGFDYETMLRVNELERIGKGFQKTWPLFMPHITKLVERVPDSRQIFTMNKYVEVIHLAH